MFKEFKEFAVKGNMLDLAVGVIIGGAFGKIVSSLVDDVLMPVLTIPLGKIDFSNKFVPLAGQTATNLADAKKDGAVLGWGVFATNIVQFVLVAFAVFLMVKAINKMRRKEEEAPTTPPAPSNEEVLLTEIRDLLKAKG